MDLTKMLFDIVSEYPMADQSADPNRQMKLNLPMRMTEEMWQGIVDFIEFKRKCSNQQFDNLLEQLHIFKSSLVEPNNEETDEKST